MEGGRIVEQGSHRELIARKGLYAQAWEATATTRMPAPDYSASPPNKRTERRWACGIQTSSAAIRPHFKPETAMLLMK